MFTLRHNKLFVDSRGIPDITFGRNIWENICESPPRYVRLSTVCVINHSFELKIPIEDRIEVCQPVLQWLSPAFSGCTLKFYSHIDGFSRSDYRFGFDNYNSLFRYISDKLLPLFVHCKQYEFHLHTDADEDGITNFVANLLTLRQIAGSFNVLIQISHYRIRPLTSLPIDAILTWLNAVGVDFKESERERILSITIAIQDIFPLIQHLKRVSIFIIHIL